MDAVAILSDLWLDVRDNDFVLSLVDLGIDHVFDTYGGFTLDELLAEFGLASDGLLETALRLAPKIIATLEGRGLLEELIRRRLAGFYESDEAQAILR